MAAAPETATYTSGGCVTVSYDEALGVPPGAATAGTLTFADGAAVRALSVLDLGPERQVRLNLGGRFALPLAGGAVATEPTFLRRRADTSVEPPRIEEWTADPDLVAITLDAADPDAGRVTGRFELRFGPGAADGSYVGRFDLPVAVVGTP